MHSAHRRHYAVLDWSSGIGASPELIAGATRDAVDRQLVRSICAMHQAWIGGLLDDDTVTTNPFPDPDDPTHDVSAWVEAMSEAGPVLIARFDDGTLTWAPAVPVHR
ncbi:hypothetical protein AB0B66_10525 [Catellatospora sp. NPDC049111]|uniref:hypothetical protein n=1 Tax=Catellatospora sp. NPDC049111 TaxID=3155271 RepID=UPI0033C9F347